MAGRRRGAPDVAAQLASLEFALKVGGGRLDTRMATRARAVIGRTRARLRLGSEHTVVALVGATGSGKSSLFNALAGIDLSEVGARRPTTQKPLACVWGPDQASPLLDWLRIPVDNRAVRESVLDADRQAGLHGLVLLDLPDHDSSDERHRQEVDRLIGLADLLIWVVDPQKYADEVLHTRYLRQLGGHDAVMLVVLNQIDRLRGQEGETCRRDLRRLLDADGLEAIELLTTSARRGDGVDELRARLAEVVQRRSGAAIRASSDLDVVARALASGLAEREPDPRALPAAQELTRALAQAAGMPALLDAVEADYRRQALERVGWPFARWWRRLRPDPLQRLELMGEAADLRRVVTASTSPKLSPAHRASVDLAVRSLATATAEALPARWADAIRAAATPPGEDLAETLDAQVARLDLGLARPAWWMPLGLAENTLAVGTVLGFGWLAGLTVLDALGLARGRPPFVGAVPLPTLALLVGLGLGGLLAVLGRWLTDTGAARRRDEVARQVQDAVSHVAWAQVLMPVSQVLADHRAAREALVPVD